MLLHIPDVLDASQLAALRARLDQAQWLDGGLTAGRQSAQTKSNGQLAEDDPLALEAGAMIRQALFRNGLFMSAALPHTVFPPLFNRYAGGQSFGTHVDNAIRDSRVHGLRVRTDLSATLFLAEPDEYEGGELLIEDTYGAHRVKLPAGDLVLYPGTSLHRVTPVTRGARIASFFWIQSMVREDAQRSLLFDLDSSIQALRTEGADSPALVRLTGVYHNLMRRWAHA